MSDTEQQTVTEGEPFAATIETTDLEQLANAVEPIDGVVTLEFGQSQVHVAASDAVNVLATVVTKPVHAPHGTQVSIGTNDLVAAVDSLRWGEDRARLEVDDELWIFDGDENRRGFASVERDSPTVARPEPTFDQMLDETDWDVAAECDAWQLAGALWTAATPAETAVRLSAGADSIMAEGDVADFDVASDGFVREWPYQVSIEASVAREPTVIDDTMCLLSEDYVRAIVGALPIAGTVEVLFGDEQPLYINSSDGVELALAPRLSDGVDARCRVR